MHKILKEVRLCEPAPTVSFGMVLAIIPSLAVLAIIFGLSFGLTAKFPAEGYSPDIGATYTKKRAP